MHVSRRGGPRTSTKFAQSCLEDCKTWITDRARDAIAFHREARLTHFAKKRAASGCTGRFFFLAWKMGTGATAHQCSSTQWDESCGAFATRLAIYVHLLKFMARAARKAVRHDRTLWLSQQTKEHRPRSGKRRHEIDVANATSRKEKTDEEQLESSRQRKILRDFAGRREITTEKEYD